MSNGISNFEDIKKFINGIEGWLSISEGEFLYYTAKNCEGKGVIVEIGSWKGKSTIFIGKGALAGKRIKVYAIDPHTGSPEDIKVLRKIWTYDEFKKNIENAGLNDIVIPIIKTSKEAAKNFPDSVEFIFIDGAHEYEMVKQDFELWFPKLIDEGIIAIHDTVVWPGPRKIVKKYIYKSKYFKNVGFVDSITFAQKTKQSSFKDRLKNRYKFYLRNRYFLFLKNRFNKMLHFLSRNEVFLQQPLKVLHVIHSSELSGPQRHILDIAKAIDKSKFTIEVACPDGWLSDELKKNNIIVYEVELKDKLSIYSLVSFYRIVRRGAYNILHGHMGRTGFYVKCAGFLTGTPVIVTEHLLAYDHSWIKNPIKRSLHLLGHRFSNRMAELVIAVSDEARNAYIKRQKIFPEKILTIHNFVDTDIVATEHDAESIRREFGINKDEIIVGYVGRLDWRKGLKTIIDVASGLVDMKFLIVGDGEDKESFLNEIKKKGLEKNFILTGTRQDIPALIKAMDIFIFPSHAPYESFGMVVIEAMSEEKSVIASDIGPVREIIVDGKDGILIPKKDPNALRSAIIKLIKNKELRKQIGEQGRKTVIERFSLSKAIKKIEEVYERIIDR